MRSFDIVQVKQEAPDCFSYILQPATGARLSFLPGQFLTFIVFINGREQRRAYSISAALPGDRFRVTVKKVDNGAVSRFIIVHWQPGTRVAALDPAGRFVLPARIKTDTRFVFIAAGSGITPVFALLQSLLDAGEKASLVLITQFRNENEIIFRQQLLEWKEKARHRFTWISLLSRPEDRGVPAQRLNNEKLEALLNINRENRAALFFLCGPLPFMRMAAYTLRETGVPEENIRRELFDPPYEPDTPFYLDPAPHRVLLRAGDRELSFVAAFPDTIMTAAARAGIGIPFSCKTGICSTCVLRRISGTVRMRVNEVLTDADLASGLVLTCVGYAISDLVLTTAGETSASPAK